jgi:membrane protease YdiL (CAAX protease family)
MAPPPVAWVPDRRSRLQRAIDAMRAYDSRPWGWRPAVLPLLALLVLAVVSGLVGAVVHVHSYAAALVLTAVLDVGLYVLLGTAVVVAGREVARRYGGFGNAFGLRKPVWRDLVWVGAGVGLVFAFRIAISIVAAATLGSKALRQGSNLQISHPRIGTIVLIAVVACACAPVVEELIFRGLLLRTLMRRVGFWPAALVSSALFGLFHTYEVSTLAGAVVLASVTASLGFTNCLLVRWTERLTPGIGVHALFNGLAVLVLALR